MNPSANRERVLLSLKWFTHRMIRSFEEKLAHAVSGLSHSRTYLSAHISPNPTPPSAVSRQHICNTDETNEIPLLNQLLEQQHRMRKRLSFESESSNRGEINCSLSYCTASDRSPLMKIRSVTNSPLFRRLSLTHQAYKRRILGSFSSQDQVHFDSPSNGVDQHESLDGAAAYMNKCSSTPQTPSEFASVRKLLVNARCPLCYFHSSTTEPNRRLMIKAFAQQLCIIYEYQLSMLRGLNAIHAAADYVVDVLLKSIKLGKSMTKTGDLFSPSILFDISCRPRTYYKCVKTCPLAVTNEQLNWRLGEIWTMPGLRYNEVGGENCHNLSIVTHFLSAEASGGDSCRSDIYGYRNIILTPVRLLIDNNAKNDSDCDRHEGDNQENIRNQYSPSKMAHSYFDLEQNDYFTIISSKTQYEERTSSDEIEKSANGFPQPPARTELVNVNADVPSQQRRRKISTSNGGCTIRQHLHRAYRPVFFVIFNRPSVIEHLTECDSFAAFCKRQALSPVMYLNQPTTVFDNKPYPCIYQNFDLFSVTVSGYSSSLSGPVPFSDVVARQHITNQFPSSIREEIHPALVNIPRNFQQGSCAYDNPGFAR